MSQGGYVTDETIGKVNDEVWGDESVQYIAKGSGNVTESFQGSTTKHSSTKGWPRMVATDRRVFIKIPQLTGSKAESVDYEDLSAADVGSSGLTGTQIKLRTVRGKTYSFKADEPGDAELEEMVDYLRGQISNQQTTDSESPSTHTSSSTADRADLHKTASCVECGEAVSEGVSRCSNCGYAPSEHKKWALVHLILGTFSAPTVVGPFVFGWKMAGHWKKYKRGVTG